MKSKQKENLYIIRTNVRPQGFFGWWRNFWHGSDNLYLISGKDRWGDLEEELHKAIRKMCK